MSKTTTPEFEHRALVRRVERREANGVTTVAGYAAVFGEVADINGYFQEVIARGAFTETLRTADVRAYYDHDRGREPVAAVWERRRLSELEGNGLQAEVRACSGGLGWLASGQQILADGTLVPRHSRARPVGDERL